MSEFKVGDKVRVTGVTPYAVFEGCEGVILSEGIFKDWRVIVTFPDGNKDDLGYNSDELELVTAPAPASETAVEAWEVHPSERELVAYGDGYEAGLKDGQAELAQVRQELDAMTAQRDRYKERVEPLTAELTDLQERYHLLDEAHSICDRVQAKQDDTIARLRQELAAERDSLTTIRRWAIELQSVKNLGEIYDALDDVILEVDKLDERAASREVDRGN